MNLRLYRLENKAGNAWWVFAESVEEAKQISVTCTRARSVENVKLIGDQTDWYRENHPGTDIDDVKVKGTACLEVHGHGILEIIAAAKEGRQLPKEIQKWRVFDGTKSVK